MIEQIKSTLEYLNDPKNLDKQILRKGNSIYLNSSCQVLSYSKNAVEVIVSEFNGHEQLAKILFGENMVIANHWDEYLIAALYHIAEEMQRSQPRVFDGGKAYTREGMIKRVMDERAEKAAKAKYHLKWADNIYGEHLLTNEKGVQYKITLRDFENETGYIDNPDLKYNKLGTTKHIMHAFNRIKSEPHLLDNLSRKYPFIEIYADPLNDYRVTWFYPHKLPKKEAALIHRYFGDKMHFDDAEIKGFMLFLRDAAEFTTIKIRNEVVEKVQAAWEEELLEVLKAENELDFSMLKVRLFPYQKEGVAFCTFKPGAILADEMGLGKTIQSIAIALNKKSIFGFKKTLIVCPASLKYQWQQEIEKFTHEKAIVLEGFPEVRRDLYLNSDAFFYIVNYEMVLRDIQVINKMAPDFVILDEAQRIKNYNTLTAAVIKKIRRKHSLVITGTPIENKLIDLYSIVQFIDPGYLAPLWEFSYKHCYFDEETRLKITGYYNLQELNERMAPILLRRTKRQVLDQLPGVTQITVPTSMHEEQHSYHAGFASGLAQILQKRFITPFDQQRIMLLLTNMRMACNSTFLIDKETYHSSKLVELRRILVSKLDIRNQPLKVIIFSEWVTMLHLIGKMLNEEGIGFTMLSGKVAVKNRLKLVNKFETDPDIKVFLSSDAGGTGLNLQTADTVINFELPWNPAKLNQRIGRIDRIGQKSERLTIINLVCKDSIEVKIASGLQIKQILFDAVLSKQSNEDIIDLSAAGKATFIHEIQSMLEDFSAAPELVEDESLSNEHETALNQIEIEASDEEFPDTSNIEISNVDNEDTVPNQKLQEVEAVMGQGMDFLSGLFKMATGKDLMAAGQKIEIDKKSGEVVMRFKIPGI